MNDVIMQYIHKLDEATNEYERELAMDALIKVGEIAVPYIVQYIPINGPKKWHRDLVVSILQKIGYPANQEALPFIVDLAADTNSPGSNRAFETIQDIGTPALPYIRDALSFYAEQYPEMCSGLCTLLEAMGSPIIDPLLPDLLHLLEIGTDENELDEYALWPLRKIGSPKAESAIPTIARRLISTRHDHKRKELIESLLNFDPVAIRPLVPLLQDCLLSQSDKVRVSAREVLRKLEL